MKRSAPRARRPRTKPYTQAGIRRLKCWRCKERQAVYQWKACSDDSWRPICPTCDVELNQLVLEFMGDPDRASKMDRYRRRVARA